MAKNAIAGTIAGAIAGAIAEAILSRSQDGIELALDAGTYLVTPGTWSRSSTMSPKNPGAPKCRDK